MLTDERQASLPAALQEVALPRRLDRLAELACNLWWTWHPSAQGVFKHIDPSLWDDTYHNPVKFLRQAQRKTLNAAVHTKAVLELLTPIKPITSSPISQPNLACTSLSPPTPAAWASYRVITPKKPLTWGCRLWASAFSTTRAISLKK